MRDARSLNAIHAKRNTDEKARRAAGLLANLSTRLLREQQTPNKAMRRFILP
jgi:hypothetical protein